MSKNRNINDLKKIKTSIERLLNIVLARPFKLSSLEYKSSSGKIYKVIKKRDNVGSLNRYKVGFKEFKNKSQNVITCWFKNQENLSLIIENFFSVFGQRGVFVENKFVSYISCLENYYKNNISKKGYLKDILEILIKQSSFEDKVDNASSFAAKLKTSRNYHAHLEEKHERNSFTAEELLEVNKVLEVIILELILAEINILEKKVIDSLTEKAIEIINKIKAST